MKLKKWVKLLLITILLVISLIIYINLGYTESNFEIFGWIIIIFNFLLLSSIEV